MGRIAFTRTAFVLTILSATVYYAYEAFNVWVAIGAGTLWWLIWTIYCNWINKNQQSEVEKYIEDFSITENPLQEYQQVVNFIYNKKQCDGHVAMNNVGIHLWLNDSYRIEWGNVKGITLINGAANTTLARFFFRNDVEVNDELFIVWNDCFNDKIPSTVYLVDSRA